MPLEADSPGRQPRMPRERIALTSTEDLLAPLPEEELEALAAELPGG